MNVSRAWQTFWSARGMVICMQKTGCVRERIPHKNVLVKFLKQPIGINDRRLFDVVWDL